LSAGFSSVKQPRVEFFQIKSKAASTASARGLMSWSKLALLTEFAPIVRACSTSDVSTRRRRVMGECFRCAVQRSVIGAERIERLQMFVDHAAVSA
jgi:hypothetical protein